MTQSQDPDPLNLISHPLASTYALQLFVKLQVFSLYPIQIYAGGAKI